MPRAFVRTTLLAILVSLPFRAVSAGPAIVESGRANAEIVVRKDAPRATQLAARELQTYVAKISGATLPIVNDPDGDVAVQIYVGTGPHTERLGVDDEGLEHGAFRIVSGDGWLALVGVDEDFVPIEPYARSRSDWLRNTRAKWDRLTGSHWSNRLAATTYRNYNEELDLWRFDRSGSLNAVYEFLRTLGVRWYMPGELGEIVPQSATIELPRVNETVRPDVPVRVMCFDRYGVPADDILWARRLGLNRHIEETFAHHGLRNVTEREEQKRAHPEFYQLVAGKRAVGDRTANACLSSEALFEENLRYLRFVFDHYDVDYVSVMPHDGFTRICECDECRPQATLDRGSAGWFSDYVWGYVVRVANELATTHPEKKILCGAYSTYQLPPLRIDRLPPNVLVQITNGRPRSETDDATHERLAKLRSAWLAKTPNKLSLTMNYPFTQRGEFRPPYFPHVIARGLRDAKGQVWREDVWIPERKGLHAPGVNHLNGYVMGRLWWDVDQDVDELLAEYYRSFYGPAAKPMQVFVEFCEANYGELASDAEKAGRALDLFAQARERADAGSVYGKRLALVDGFLETLRKRRDQLGKGRGAVPEFRAYNFENRKFDAAKQKFELDGRLEEPFWNLRAGLKGLEGGGTVEFGTRFQVLCDDDAVYFGIRCEEADGRRPKVTTERDGDPSIWSGDHVEILLETDAHSYYQIVVNPAGAVLDLDRGVAKRNWFDWSSKAEVGAHAGAGFWSVEVKVPFTQDDSDPLHLVVGRKPSKNLPWYFNVCRKRERPEGTETSAFSPTGQPSFHAVRKFGKLYSK